MPRVYTANQMKELVEQIGNELYAAAEMEDQHAVSAPLYVAARVFQRLDIDRLVPAEE